MADRLLNVVVKFASEGAQGLKIIGDDLAGGLSKMSNAAGVAAGAIKGFSIAAVKGLADTGEHFENLSKQTGISVLALSSMKATSDQMGLSLESIIGHTNKMQMALSAMGDDTKKATEALKPLGLTLDDLKGLKPEEQFFELGNKIAAIKDPTERTAQAMKFFGKSGTELLPFFNNGTASLADMEAEAKKLGLSFDELAVDKAAKADAAFDAMTKSAEGAEQQIAIALAPAVTNLVNQITPLIQTLTQWVEKNPELTQTILEVTTGILSLIFIAPKVVAGVQAISTAMAFLTANPLGLLILGIAALVAWFIYLWNTNEDFRKAVIIIWGAILEFLKPVWAGIQVGLKLLMDNIKVQWEQWGALLTSLQVAWNQITGVLSEAWGNINGSINEGMATAKATWDGFWVGMQNTVDGIVKTILGLIGQISGAINGAVKAAQQAMSFVSSAGGGGAASGLVASAAKVSGKRAGGGSVNAGETYLVGEKGPELLTMGGGNGYVTPNNAMGGGNTFVFTGNNFLDENSATKIMDMVIQKLRYQRKLA